MSDQPERLCRIHSLEFGTFELKPGGSLRLGRHSDNDIRLKDSMVSRFHSRITWDAKVDHPVIFDNGSQNGTLIDGEAIRTARPLKHEMKITVGPFILRVELTGLVKPAVLEDTNDMVTLFSDEGPELRGELRPDFTIQALMQRIEAERRTGTLRLKLDTEATVVYCLGRIMTARYGTGDKGLRALERILRTRKTGAFEFSRELEPQEEALNLWVSDFIRSRNMLDPADATQRFNAKSLQRPGDKF